MEDTYIEMIGTRILVSVNTEDYLIAHERLKLRVHEGHPYLRLGDISQQIKLMFPHENISIDVWTELGIKGYIYRYDSYTNVWREHGTTKGYA